MNIKFDRAGMSLDKDDFLRLEDAAGTCVHCRKGALWITQDNDLKDYVLGPGETLELEHGGDAIVYALLQSDLVLREPKPQESAAGRSGHALAAMARSTGKWIALHFGPQAITNRNLRGWYGAM